MNALDETKAELLHSKTSSFTAAITDMMVMAMPGLQKGSRGRQIKGRGVIVEEHCCRAPFQLISSQQAHPKEALAFMLTGWVT